MIEHILDHKVTIKFKIIEKAYIVPDYSGIKLEMRKLRKVPNI